MGDRHVAQPQPPAGAGNLRLRIDREGLGHREGTRIDIGGDADALGVEPPRGMTVVRSRRAP